MTGATVAARLARSVAVVASAGTITALLVSAGSDLRAAPVSIETVLAAGFAYAGAAISAYLALATAVSAVETAATRREPRSARALPAAARRFLAGGLGVALALGTTVPATATDAVSPGWAPTTASESPVASPVASASPVIPRVALAPAPPDVSTRARPETPPALAPPAATWTPPTDTPAPEPPARASVHVVRPGDSLWRIAANHLGRGTFDAAIARAWPIIYQANRDVIGDDPGFIRPGQRLLIPAEVNP